ncbi:MAG: hypothetical protein M3Z85_05790 [Acidobacteriota bacterium]|nr:hypothetical protein [Acidobacteriota bacterium]
MQWVRVIGGGPAGSSAAIGALSEGVPVELFEKSTFPRHKVCGEFLSPEIAPLLHRLGVLGDFESLRPARLSRIHLAIGSSQKRWQLPEPAYGLSRFALDHLLLRQAVAQGAILRRERCPKPPTPAIIAHGRKTSAPAGSRLFGFKAHFSGPVSDAVDLFFFSGCYAGVSAVENAGTNVCGLAPETLLRERNFEIESLLPLCRPFAERLAPLTRTMDWLITGPLFSAMAFGYAPPLAIIWLAMRSDSSIRSPAPEFSPPSQQGLWPGWQQPGSPRRRLTWQIAER